VSLFLSRLRAFFALCEGGSVLDTAHMLDGFFVLNGMKINGIVVAATFQWVDGERHHDARIMSKCQTFGLHKEVWSKLGSRNKQRVFRLLIILASNF
jgi:hypothetical protein